MKKCNGCKRTLDELDFIKEEKDHKTCNKCRTYKSIYDKKYRLDNPEKSKKAGLKYRRNNLDKIREYDRVWKINYRKEHPEEYRKYVDEYNEKNKDKIKAHDLDRMLNRPEYFLFNSARMRARKYNAPFTITEQDIKELINKTTECPLRKTTFERGSDHRACDNSLSIDRIDATKGYTKNNIQVLSYRANIIKNNINVETFELIVNRFKNFKLELHDINSDTRRVIIEDRLDNFINTNRDEKDRRRLLNIEGSLLNSAKKRIKKSKLEINIDINYIRSIWPLDNKCPILNEKFVFGKSIMSDNSATIDRIDNTKGYIKGNIRIISAKANTIKNKATLEELEFILQNWKILERK